MRSTSGADSNSRHRDGENLLVRSNAIYRKWLWRRVRVGDR
jgi:hypothetical protein